MQSHEFSNQRNHANQYFILLLLLIMEGVERLYPHASVRVLHHRIQRIVHNDAVSQSGKHRLAVYGNHILRQQAEGFHKVHYRSDSMFEMLFRQAMIAV